jgi:hypothetical protein
VHIEDRPEDRLRIDESFTLPGAAERAARPADGKRALPLF